MAIIEKLFETKQHAKAVSEIVKLVKPSWVVEFQQVPDDDAWRVIVKNDAKTSRLASKLVSEASEIYFQNTIHYRNSIAMIQEEKKRVFRAFCNAHSSLQLGGFDTRTFAVRVEAEAVMLIETGEIKGMGGSDIQERVMSFDRSRNKA